MAVIDTTRAAHVSGGFALISSAYASVLNWNDARNTRKALNKLSNRELDDIGLSRGDIEVVAMSGPHR